MRFRLSVSLGRTMKKKLSTSENQSKAPLCAEFVRQMRECFPDLVVLSVDENGVKLGEARDAT